MTNVRSDRRSPAGQVAGGRGPRQGWNGNRSRGFTVTNHFTNPILIWLLEGRYGSRLGRSLAIVRYTGTATGLPRRLITQYERAEDHVTITVGVPERKQWWRNFTTPQPIELTLAGSTYAGTATASPAEVGTVTVIVDLDGHDRRAAPVRTAPPLAGEQDS